MQIATREASYRHATEDRIVTLAVDGGLVVVVASGFAGVAGGGAAATMAVALSLDAVRQSAFSPGSPTFWFELLQRVDSVVERNAGCGETSAVVLGIRAGMLVGASCGDSGALLLHADEQLIELTANQSRKLRLGSGRVAPLGFTAAFAAEDTLLVASAGLFAHARQPMIRERLEDPNLERGADELVELVRLPSGGWTNDLGLVLVRNSSVSADTPSPH